MPYETYRRRSRRYYCPVCGTVRDAYKHWVLGLIVEDHEYMTGDSWRIKFCPGGPVTESDKAP